jgi:hypothetical protein
LSVNFVLGVYSGIEKPESTIYNSIKDNNQTLDGNLPLHSNHGQDI